MDNNYGGSYFEGRKQWKMAEGENGGIVASDFLMVDDLLDFSNEEIAGPIVGGKNGADSSTVTDSLMSMSCTREDVPLHDIGDSYGEFDANDYTGDLCVPCDDVAELEWLSNFVEDSFSTGSVVSNGEMNMNECAKKQCHEKDRHPVPGKARSKRSRAPVCNWVSYILSPSSSTTTKPCDITNGGTTSEVTYLQGYEATTTTMKLSKGTATQGGSKKKLGGASSHHHHHHSQHQEQTRRCTHCGTQKTPQWRAGPQGPKTLCNACGVRYKSGRLLPEYRPAASPTFVMSQHSNSHRKVLEMRRQREAEDHQHHFQEIVQGLMRSDQSSYIEDECLLHTNHNTREDNFCRV